MNPFENILSAVRQKRPLVHFITNYVTVNDCANMTLALGGSPIMADDLREVEQIVGHCSALVPSGLSDVLVLTMSPQPTAQ